MKFHKTPDFRELERIWRRKLKQDKFQDIEDRKERLIEKNKRTIAYENQELIRDYFLDLDHFMTHFPEMPKFERQVMELYCRGIYICDIAKQTRVKRLKVFRIVRRYKDLIIAINRLYASIHYAPSMNSQSDSGSGAVDGQNRCIEDSAA